MVFVLNKKNFWHFDKIWWEFLFGILVEPIIRLIKVILVASTQTYLPSREVASTQTYLPSPEVASTRTYLPSLEVASSKTSVACIKRSAPTQFHIIWYKSFSSWYKFYPILLFFFVIYLGSCLVLVLLFAFLFRSCFVLVCVLCSVICVLVLVTFLFLFLVSFTLCVKKKLQKFWKKKLGV